MRVYAVIMIGGAIGSALRYALANSIDYRLHPALPLGTILVNIIGCFIIGFFLAVMEGSFSAVPLLRAFVMIGILGGFTTFSSFSLQTILLMQNGSWAYAFGNVLVSVLACLTATALGVFLGGLTRA